MNSENNENLTINCENKNLIFEVFRLTLAYFWRSFNYILPDTGHCNGFNENFAREISPAKTGYECIARALAFDRR